MDNATPDQVDLALRLCDLLGLQDFTVAMTILQQLNWDIQKAVQSILGNASPTNSSKTQQTDLPPHYANAKEEQQPQEQQENENLFQYQFNRQQRIKNNERIFNQAFQQVKLDRSTSQAPQQLQRRLSDYRKIIQDFSSHRHAYQCHLMQESQKFCKKYLTQKQQQNVGKSLIKSQTNRNFISYLHKNYRCQINFTFGTLMLNLVRSYLDKKYLLVYIHKVQFQDSRCLRMILSNNQITKFINANCITYGMFDNSDDYDIVQKYVSLKQLPAFVLFKFDNKNRQQRFLSSYPILQRQQSNLMEWLAANIGINLVKKQKITQKQVQQKEETKAYKPNYSHRSIMTQQNLQYEQMERIYKLRRQQSKLKKQQITNAEAQIEKMKVKFREQPKLEQGKSIQIRFRLPESGKSITRIFDLSDKIKVMFQYVNCFGRCQFQQKFADFDLVQTFPRLSLKYKQDKIIKQLFETCSHENIIVKQL